jgi:hypothetical protein
MQLVSCARLRDSDCIYDSGKLLEKHEFGRPRREWEVNVVIEL